MTKLSELSQHYFDLLNANSEDSNMFYELINKSFKLLEFSDLDVAVRFGMSKPSVSRWKNGRTAPHPAMRPPAYKWFAKRTKEAMNAICSEYNLIPAASVLEIPLVEKQLELAKLFACREKESESNLLNDEILRVETEVDREKESFAYALTKQKDAMDVSLDKAISILDQRKAIR